MKNEMEVSTIFNLVEYDVVSVPTVWRPIVSLYRNSKILINYKVRINH